MKKVLANIFCLLIVCMTICSCDNGNETPSTITVPDKEELNQSFTAHQNDGGIHFDAQAPWSASVSTESRADGSWIDINPKSGNAGKNQVINITLEENTTGTDRTATITIVCGETVITITVTQSNSYESNGDEDEDDSQVPEPIIKDRVVSITAYGIEKATGEKVELYRTDFEYDGKDQEKPSLIHTTGGYNMEGYNTTFSSTYEFNSAQGILTVQSEENYSDLNSNVRSDVWNELWNIESNEKGYVTQAKGRITSNGTTISEAINKFTYTDDGHLATNYFFQKNIDGYNDGPSTTLFVWQNGNQISQQDKDTGELWNKMEYGNEMNDGPLDLNQLICDGSYPIPDYTTLIMNLGVPSANLQTQYYTWYEWEDDSATAPASIAMRSRVSHSGYEATEISYERDEKERVTTIRYKQPKTVTSTYYSETVLQLEYFLK